MIREVRSEVFLRGDVAAILRGIAMAGGSIGKHLTRSEIAMHPNEVEMYGRGFADAIAAMAAALNLEVRREG